MKPMLRDKRLLVMLALTILLAAGACGDGTSGRDTSSNPANPAPTARAWNDAPFPVASFTPTG